MKCYLLWAVLILPQTMQTQLAHVRELLNTIQQPAGAEVALEELRQLALSSATNKKEIENGLADLLKVKTDSATFKREVDLARELNLSTLCPIIAQSLDRETRDVEHRIGGFAKANGPGYDPAMKALISFGSASIPALLQELNVGNRLGRFRAAYTLSLIGGPAVDAAFRERYYKETDAGLKNYLGSKSGLLNNKM